MPALLLRSLMMTVFLATPTFPLLLATSAAAIELPNIIAPAIAGGKQAIPLSAKVDDLVVGGGGRYLALLFASQKRIGIFDVNELKLIGEVPAEADSEFAAGASKLLVAHPEKGTIVRYDLPSQKEEQAEPIDRTKKIMSLVMGSASEGPALIYTFGKNTFKGEWSELDLLTLKSEHLDLSLREPVADVANARISAEGNVLTQWTSSSGWRSHVKRGSTWVGVQHGDHCGHVAPNHDGSLLFTAAGVFQSSGANVFKTPTYGEKWELCVPAVDGPYYLVVAGDPGDSKTTSVGLRLGSESKTRDVISNLEPVLEKGDRWAREPLTIDKRLLFIPQAKLILQLSAQHNSLIAVQYDAAAALQRSTDPYLHVTSHPPRAIQVGQRVNYQLTALSSGGDLRYALEAGPAGMRVSPTGLLTWVPTAKSPAANEIIIAVRDKSNQLTYQSFSLEVIGGDATASSAATASPVGAPPNVAASPVKPLPVTPIEGKQEHRTIDLPGKVSDAVCAANGRFLILKFGELKKIGVFDISLVKMAGYLPAEEDVRIAAGATRLLVCDSRQKTIQRYRLDTLEQEATAPLPFGSDTLMNIALGAGSEGPALVRTSQGTSALAKGQLQFLDVATLKVIETRWLEDRAPSLTYRDQHLIYAAANAPVFSVTGLGAVRFSANEAEYVGSKFLDKIAGGYPSAGGNFYLFKGQSLDADQRPLAPRDLDHAEFEIPAVSGNYYLSFMQFSPLNGTLQDVGLHAFGEKRPLAKIPELRFDFSPHASQAMAMPDKRIILVPDAQALVTFPGTSNQLEIHRLNIDEALAATDFDYLLVDSTPPSQALLGKTFNYDLKVKSKRGGVTFKLDTGPPGMTISPAGKLVWEVPASFPAVNQRVMVTVSDASAQSQVHGFWLDLPEVRIGIAKSKGQAEDERKLALEAVKKRLLEEQAGAVTPAKNAQPLRAWKDSTRTFTTTARFVEILDKKTVVLELENGETRKIPLGKLADEDIYEAVKLDLQRQNPPAKAANPSTPFDN